MEVYHSTSHPDFAMATATATKQQGGFDFGSFSKPIF